MGRALIAFLVAATTVAQAAGPALDPTHPGTFVAPAGCQRWRGRSLRRDENFDAQLCTDGVRLTGWIKSDMPAYGWDRVTVEGLWSDDHRLLAMHDVTSLEQHPVADTGFCMIDRYRLRLLSSGHLEGDYSGARCHSGGGEMELDLVVQTVAHAAPAPVEKSAARLSCSAAPGERSNPSSTTAAACALLLLLSSTRARRRSHRPA